MSETQHLVNASADQAQKIVEGAGLNMAFKTPAGQTIANAILERFADMLEHLILDPQTDDQVLRTYYELRGMVKVCEGVGDSIKQATQIVAKSSLQQKLRVRREEGG